jgi:hypothetical protein
MKKRELDYLITEEIKNFLKEGEALGTTEPMKLSTISKDLAKAAISTGPKDTTGAKDEDVVVGKTKGVPFPVASLLPMQKEVIPDKALSFALGFLHNGEPDLDEMEAIVSNDKPAYIMDGHHRWAARTLIDPAASVTTAQVQLPAEELITALNIYTVQAGETGKEGRGDIKDFAKGIGSGIIDNVMQGGTKASKDEKGRWPNLSAEEVKAALGKVPGADGDAEEGKKLMIANATKLPTKKHPKAPSRIEMPAIEKQPNIDKVVAKLAAGEIDIHPPYSKETSSKLKTKGDEDKEREEEKEEVTETKRWQKLAGIN